MMDNQRLILWLSLGFIVLLLWQAWQADHAPHPATAQAPTTRQAPSPSQPAAASDTPEARLNQAPPPAAPATATGLHSAGRVHVRTDVLDLEIDLEGGDLRQVDLPRYPVSVQAPDHPTRLLADRPPRIFVAQTGIRSATRPEPTHHALFTAAKKDYRLAEGQDSLVVELQWRSPQGIQVTKRYRFRRGSYLVALEQEVHNGSNASWTGRPYRQLLRNRPVVKNKRGMGSRVFTGAAYYSPEDKYEKLSFKAMDEAALKRTIRGGWAAMVEHYFLAAWIPPAKEKDLYYTRVLPGERYIIGMLGAARTLAPGAAASFHSRIWVGPKLQDHLAQVAPGLELTVDYGILTVLAKPIFWLLKAIHRLIGNWGWAIILLTLLIKLAFYKLSETSYRSMANMRRLAPRLKALKERYGDDKQKLNQAMMELYRTEKINPLGGCLPIVVQIPVFIALYWVLLESVELRQAPFILWIQDLSTKDPYFVLPVIMGISMFIQQKLNPAPMDPLQARVMMLLPLIFTVFFAFFPSGLVLYWVTNNILSIAQQWMINRRIEGAGAH